MKRNKLLVNPIQWAVLVLVIIIKINLCVGEFTKQPKIITKNGNLIFEGANDRNISFLMKGRGIFKINDVDYRRLIRPFPYTNQNQTVLYSQLLRSLTNLETLIGPEGPSILIQRLELLEGNWTQNVSNDRAPGPGALNQRISVLEGKIETILTKLTEDNCRSMPCQNGGTCIDLYDSFGCHCPAEWDGPNCSNDVNECMVFAGTDLGCQNGGTCQNTRGGYICHCKANFYGTHCRSLQNDCGSGNAREMCGHGYCINVNNNGNSYKCICDAGWTTNPAISPACNVDIDECNGVKQHCSKDPLVMCQNIPGSYNCGPCPTGFTGNGFYCTDINECEMNNGGCAIGVRCENTHGSYQCGSCPTGFQGDGRLCIPTNTPVCPSPQCHSVAYCVPSQSGVICSCPSGYTGNGYGPTGCMQLPSSHCASNPCKNGGTCSNTTLSYTCQCPTGVSGVNCEHLITSPSCLSNPCLNGGICQGTTNVNIPYVCSCLPGWRGTQCENEVRSCGGLRISESGTIKYPPFGHVPTTERTKCVWMIRVNESKILNLTFTQFNISQSNECRQDFLQIHDGKSTATPLIGRFCGNDLPAGGNIKSTHNTIYLWLALDTHSTEKGITLRWETIEPVCGGLFENKSTGMIKSPGFPGLYPINRDCDWTIRTQAGNRFNIHFYTLQLENSEDCEHDYLAVYSGTVDGGHQIAKYCNSTEPPYFKSPGHELSFLFHSDDSGTDAGFQLTYTVESSYPGCGGVFTRNSGEFGSPTFNGNYPSSVTCDYLIQTMPNTKIKVTFLSLDIEEHTSCQYDKISLYDGPNEDSPFVKSLCGSVIPDEEFISSQNTYFLQFTSDASVSYPGFQVHYEEVCEIVYTAPNGTITSIPSRAKDNMQSTCYYKIFAPEGNYIVLTFDKINIDGPQDCSYASNVIKVYDGLVEEYHLVSTICNSSPEENPITSVFNEITLEYTTFESSKTQSFEVNYKFVDGKCGGIRKESGIIRSNEIGQNYEAESECMWVIIAPKGNIIRLNWISFDLENEGSSRCYDYVQLFDNSTNGDIGMFCGKSKPLLTMSASNMLKILFKTDFSNNFGGFELLYDFVNATNLCGGSYFNGPGYIRSPGWPKSYVDNKDCIYTITAPFGKKITLTVNNFTLEEMDSCSFDYLEIRNGATAQSPLLGKYCGTQIPKIIQSLTNQIRLRFHSDVSRSLGGFEIEYEASVSGCGGTVSGYTGYINSPNYPNEYNSYTICAWRINVNKGSTIQVAILDLDFEQSSCHYDYIEFYDGSDSIATHLGKYCHDHPQLITSTGNSMYISMKTDGSDSGRGFRLKYTTNCNTTLTNSFGIIESPNYPNEYPREVVCEWIIKAPVGSKVHLDFDTFVVEESHSDDTETTDCRFDYMQIVTVNERHPDRGSERFGRYCRKVPDKITSANNMVKIMFRSDHSNTDTGFMLEYSIEGCGGDFKNVSGVITSPGYPNRYPLETECIWKITTDYGKLIEITIEHMNMEISHECRYDGVYISNTNDFQNNTLGKYCEKIKTPKTLTSNRHEVYIKFLSDMSSTSSGFKATYKTVTAMCGGNFTIDKAIITTPNYPKNYPSDLHCEWLITINPNHRINLKIIDFDVEETPRCSLDSFNLYDGDAISDDKLLLRHCRQQMPNQTSFLSTNNVMLVTFDTDSSVGYKGFKLEYKTACGAILEVDDIDSKGIIESPTAQFDGNCTWTIKAKDLTKRLRITFNQFHPLRMSFTESEDSSEECYHKIDILNGDTPNSPLIKTFCGRLRDLAPIISDGPFITISTNLDRHMSGISDCRIEYSLLDSICGGDFSVLEGIIASPNYPSIYPESIECIWFIRAAAGNTLSLNVLDLDIFQGNGGVCSSDSYLEIRETSSSGRLLDVLCGSENQTKAYLGAGFWIKFESGTGYRGRGFELQFEYATDNEVFGDEGVIESPLYPLNFIKRKSLDIITYRITVAHGFLVSLKFDKFFLTTFETCATMFMIFDGYDQTAPLLVQDSCEIDKQPKWMSTTNVVFIRFESGQLNIFLLQLRLLWKKVPKVTTEIDTSTVINDAKCGNMSSNIILTNYDDKYFISPGYPDGYPIDLNCSWIISTNLSTFHVRFYFTHLDLDTNPECYSDYVELFKSSDMIEWISLGRYCYYPPSVKSFDGNPFLKINFITNYYGNRTGFRGEMRVECGNTLHDPSGVILYQLPTNRMLTSQSCTWMVIVSPGRMIEFEFEEINVDCTSTSIVIKNGIDDSSPVLGGIRYCGTNDKKPVIPMTSGNRALIIIRDSIYAASFKLSYKEKSKECEERIILSHNRPYVMITSPNYPEVPDPFDECSWIVSSESGENLKYEFTGTFDLKNSENCEKEYVEIRRGITSVSQVVARFCSLKPNPEIVQSNVLRIKYYTGMSEPNRGFQMNITIALCGAVYTSISDVIHSPYSSNDETPQYMECFYHIIGHPGHTLTINIEEISLSYNDGNCEDAEHIEIYSQDSMNNPIGSNDTISMTLMSVICEDDSYDESLIIPDGEAVIKYVTKDLEYAHSKWRISYNFTRVICDGQFRGESGYITSPGYPNAKQTEIFCNFKIEVPEGRRVRVDLLDIGHKLKSSQRLFFFMEPIMLAERIRQTDTIDTIGPIYSSSNKMIVKYNVYSPSNSPGFKLRYSSDETSVCVGDLNQMSGTIEATKNITSYICEFSRTSQPFFSDDPSVGTMAIQFNSITYFSLYYFGFKVDYDLGPNQEDNTILINSLQYEMLRVPSPNIKISMRDNRKYRSEYADDLKMIYKVHKCGGTIQLDYTKVISMPQINATNYGKIDCAWLIIAGASQDIVLNITSATFKLTQIREFIRVFQGGSQKHPVIATFNKDHAQSRQIKSKKHLMLIEYHSDDYNKDSSFSLTVEATSDACGGILTQHEMHLSSPKISSTNLKYPNNIECVWEIHSKPGYHIGLQFVNRFFLEDSVNCTKDFVELFDWTNNHWLSLGRVCGRTIPKIFNSTSDKMKVKFRSDETENGDGFSVTWFNNCGSVLTASETVQTLISPNYPGNYNNLQYCVYNITAPEGTYVKIHFVSTNIEQCYKCDCDTITLYKPMEYMTDGSVDHIGTYCGYENPPDRRQENRIDIVFQSDIAVTKAGFMLEYSIDSCGEVVTKSQSIESPMNVDGKYLKSSDCYWNITAPVGYKITVQFEYISLEYVSQCYYDYVDIFRGPEKNVTNNLARLCGNFTAPPIIFIPDNKGLIQFHSDSSNEYAGFKAYIIFSANCDEKYELTENSPIQIIHNITTEYSSFLDCQFKVLSPADTKIQIQFKQFHIAPCDESLNRTNNCSCDFIELRDGMSSIGEFIGRYCGHTLPPTTTTAHNSLWMHFMSDSSRSSTGFEVEFRMITSQCGQQHYNISTGGVIYLESPNDNSKYLNNLNCMWTFETTESEVIEIFFEKLNIQSVNGDSVCVDYLEFISKPETHSYITEGKGDIIAGSEQTHSSFYSGLRNPPIKTRYCGSKIPGHYLSSGKSVIIKFFSNDDGIVDNGFKLKIRSHSACTRNYTSTQGRLKNFENNLCEVYLQAPENYTLSLFIANLYYYSSNCEEDGFWVYEDNSNGKLLFSKCSSSYNDYVFSNSSQLFLRSKRHSGHHYYETDLYYLASDKGLGCGGELFNYAGMFSSPNYGKTERSYQDCRWDIAVPQNYNVSLRFSEFDLGTNRTCDTNYVEIIEVSSNGDENVARKYCGDMMPGVYRGMRNVLSLRFKKTLNFAGLGFVVQFVASVHGTELADW